MSHYVDLEIIQTLPFSNANRDDSGQPKTVRIGGTSRGRLSSQSLKRAARFYGADKSEGFGIKGDTSGGSYFRTRYALNLVRKAIEELGGTTEDLERAAQLFNDSVLGKIKAGSGSDKTEKNDVLIVLTQSEIFELAQLVIDNEISSEKIVSILQNSGKRDLALWGRFFASSSAASLDGSAQVAHAFTTHKVNLEPDFFVGLDDGADLFSDHAGAGHPDEAYYLTGTFYKYANFNIEETILNLVNAQVVKGELVIKENEVENVEVTVDHIVENFINNFVLSVPQGKIRSTAHQTLPTYVRVSVRNNRPVNAGTAFEEAVNINSVNIPLESTRKLIAAHSELEKFVGKPLNSFSLASTAVTNELSEHSEKFVDSLVELVALVKEVVRPIVEETLTRLRNK